jgi:hypothetical protein
MALVCGLEKSHSRLTNFQRVVPRPPRMPQRARRFGSCCTATSLTYIACCSRFRMTLWWLFTFGGQNKIRFLCTDLAGQQAHSAGRFQIVVFESRYLMPTACRELAPSPGIWRADISADAARFVVLVCRVDGLVFAARPLGSRLLQRHPLVFERYRERAGPGSRAGPCARPASLSG